MTKEKFESLVKEALIKLDLIKDEIQDFARDVSELKRTGSTAYLPVNNVLTKVIRHMATSGPNTRPMLANLKQLDRAWLYSLKGLLKQNSLRVRGIVASDPILHFDELTININDSFEDVFRELFIYCIKYPSYKNSVEDDIHDYIIGFCIALIDEIDRKIIEINMGMSELRKK